jgi:quercetin dioxygenase-like cupin family protein
MSEKAWIPIVDGIRRQTLAVTEHMMQIIVRLDANAILPAHQHPEEQITHMISGRLRFTINGEELELGPGESLAIPGGVQHAAQVLEESVAIDTFSPPRQDMLAQDRAMHNTSA